MLPEIVGMKIQCAPCYSPDPNYFPRTITQQLRGVIETLGPRNQKHHGLRIELCGTCRRGDAYT
jgi:hypothetical protein